MKLGIGSWTYAWAATGMSALDLVARARELEVDVLQYADNMPLHLLSSQDLGALRREAGDLIVEVGTRGIQREHLRRYLEIAATLESPLLRVIVDTEERQPTVDEVVRSLAAIVPDLSRAGVSLAVENHDRLSSLELARIVRAVDHPLVGVCLDTVNSFGALEGPVAVLEHLAPFVLNLHVKDFQIRRAAHNLGFVVEGTPAGRGRLDVPWLVARLEQARRNPNAILELWTPPEADLEATIRKEAQWARESIRYLRTVIAR